MRRANRLRRPEQFRRVRQQGRTFASPWLLLNVAPGRRAMVRCGFVVGRRIGSAVQRNRARRRVREAVRLLLPSIVTGYDLVFVVRTANVIDVPFTQLQQDIAALLRQANLLADPEPAASDAFRSQSQHQRGSQ